MFGVLEEELFSSSSAECSPQSSSNRSCTPTGVSPVRTPTGISPLHKAGYQEESPKIIECKPAFQKDTKKGAKKSAKKDAKMNSAVVSNEHNEKMHTCDLSPKGVKPHSGQMKIE